MFLLPFSWQQHVGQLSYWSRITWSGGIQWNESMVTSGWGGDEKSKARWQGCHRAEYISPSPPHLVSAAVALSISWSSSTWSLPGFTYTSVKFARVDQSFPSVCGSFSSFSWVLFDKILRKCKRSGSGSFGTNLHVPSVLLALYQESPSDLVSYHV